MATGDHPDGQGHRAMAPVAEHADDHDGGHAQQGVRDPDGCGQGRPVHQLRLHQELVAQQAHRGGDRARVEQRAEDAQEPTPRPDRDGGETIT
jgi:hypothetical protein